MINCPACQALNEPNSRFCINCGQVLPGNQMAEPSSNPSLVYRRYLAIATARVVIALFLVWFLKGVLLNLSFIEGLIIPSIPFSAAQMINLIAYLVAFVLLVGFTQTLRSYWALSFPTLANLTPALLVIIYVVLLSIVYQALLPILVELINDPRDFVLALQVTLAILAVILLAWVGKIIYDALPGWLGSIRFDTPNAASNNLICAHCGKVNPGDHQYCGYCGQALFSTPERPTADELP